MKKKKILFIGCSNFFRNRIYPSIKNNKLIDIYLSSKTFSKFKNLKIIKNYKIDKKIKYDFIYISLINKLHFKYARKFLANGNNIIVDKPIVTSFKQFEKLFQIAKKKNVFILESTFFSYHKVFDFIKKDTQNFKKIQNIIATFHIPANGNKYKLDNLKRIGLSATTDMSSYAIYILKNFYNSDVKNKTVFFKYFENKLIKEFNIMTEYKNKKIFYGSFGFKSEYQSSIKFISSKKIYLIDHQAFALRNNKIKVKIKINNKWHEVNFKDNLINNYFNHILFMLKNKKKYIKRERDNLLAFYKLKNYLGLI